MYELNGFSRAPRIVRHGTLLPGDAGTAQTVEMMRGLARDGARDQRVRAAAILACRGARDHDLPAQLDCIFRYVRDQVRFVPDPVGVETLQAPWVTLYQRAGDCDDRAVLMVAMAQSVGIEADFDFRVIAANPARRGEFSHVYVVAKTAAGPVAMDPTYHNSPLGFEPARFRMRDFPAMSFQRGSLGGPVAAYRNVMARLAPAVAPLKPPPPPPPAAASAPKVVAVSPMLAPILIARRPDPPPARPPIPTVTTPMLVDPYPLPAPPIQQNTAAAVAAGAMVRSGGGGAAAVEPLAAGVTSPSSGWLPLLALAALGLLFIRKGPRHGV